MNWQKYKFGDFLNRSKLPIIIEDHIAYKRVTIKMNHKGVFLRDEEFGSKIGTKRQFLLKEGQFVLSKIDARNGAFGIAPEEVNDAIITGNFWAYDVDFSIIDIDWFNQFTNSQEFYQVCEDTSTGITNRKYLKEDFFLNYEINLPPIKDQKLIVQKYLEKQRLIVQISKEIEKQSNLLEELRESLLRESLRGKNL